MVSSRPALCHSEFPVLGVVAREEEDNVVGSELFELFCDQKGFDEHHRFLKVGFYRTVFRHQPPREQSMEVLEICTRRNPVDDCPLGR